MRLRFALFAGLLGLGCNQLPTASQVAQPPIQVSKAEAKPEQLPKRLPKPATCVALGNATEAVAQQPGVQAAQREKLVDQSRQAYQQALATDPKNRDALLSLARLYMRNGDHARAIAAYQKALDAYPKDAGIWNELGMCHAQKKDWKPALDSLYQAVRHDPENKTYNHVYGYCLARAGHHEESAQAFARLTDEATAHYNVARMLHHMKNTDLCRLHLQKALDKDAQHADAKQLLAALSQPAGDTEVAEPKAVIQQ